MLFDIFLLDRNLFVRQDSLYHVPFWITSYGIDPKVKRESIIVFVNKNQRSFATAPKSFCAYEKCLEPRILKINAFVFKK